MKIPMKSYITTKFHSQSGYVNRDDSLDFYRVSKIGVFRITEQLVSLASKWAETGLCNLRVKNVMQV